MIIDDSVGLGVGAEVCRRVDVGLKMSNAD